jgi:hypothetical protein
MYKTIFSLRRTVAAFAKDTRGAVTVDWVVLTAALVLMVIGVFVIVNEQVLVNAAGGIVVGLGSANDVSIY